MKGLFKTKEEVSQSTEDKRLLKINYMTLQFEMVSEKKCRKALLDKENSIPKVLEKKNWT
jgi:hypothetical protein